MFSDRAVGRSLVIECPGRWGGIHTFCVHTALPAGPGGQGIQPSVYTLFTVPFLGFVEFRLHKILYQIPHGVIFTQQTDGQLRLVFSRQHGSRYRYSCS